MKRSTNLAWSELKVGILLVSALLIGTVGVVSFTGIREFFRPTFPMYTDMQKVSGLKPGALVMLSGVRVGSVTRLSLERVGTQGVRVEMRVYENHRQDIHADAIASLGSQGLLGDKYVELAPGSPDTPQVETAAVIVADNGSADFENIMGQAKDMTTRLNDLVVELTALTRQMRSGEGTIGRMMTDPALYNSARDATRSMNRTAEELSATARESRNAASSFTTLGKDLNTTLLAPDGTLKRLAENPEPFEHLNSAMARLDSVLGKIDKGDGTVGTVVNNDAIAVELAALLRDMRKLVKDFEENPKKYINVSVF